MRGAPLARATASMRCSRVSCACVANRTPPCRWYTLRPSARSKLAGTSRRLRCLQAGHRLELRPQRPVSDFLEQRGGRRWVHAGAGQHPAQVLDHIRAGPGALLLLGQRDRLLRRPAHLQLAGDRAGTARAARPRARVSPAVVPHRRRDRRQAHAEGARELVRPARVYLREVERAVLGVARLEVGRLREPRQLALRRLAAQSLLELRRADTQVRGDRLPARGKHAHHLTADAFDLEAVPVIACYPRHAEPAGQRLLQVLGHDRGDRADVLVVTQGIRRPPLPVGDSSRRRGRSGSGRATACRRRGRCAAASAPQPVPPRATGRSPGRAPGCCATRCGCSPPPAGSSQTQPGQPARSCHRPRLTRADQY